MRLTDKQTEALALLRDCKSLPSPCIQLHGNVFNALYKKNLITKRLYSDGWWWEVI